jgi:ATP-binding cassette subfamily F protein uup
MTVVTASGIEKVWGDRVILRGADLQVAPGERVGLVGANGSGKSTLLAVIGGAMASDGGTVDVRGRVELLEQEPHLVGETVGDAVLDALAWHAELLRSYERALEDGDMLLASSLQDRIEHHGWELEHRVDAMLDRLHAPPRERLLDGLSGGERRRVALARALLAEPDVLLLDEPTNHLDADTVDWLQDWLERFRGAAVLVTHDRYLLEAVATRIVEVEDGVTVSYDGSYADYLISRAERQASLRRAEDSRLAMIAREAEWASRSPAARSTKQKARLERLEALQAQRKLPKQAEVVLDLRTGLKQGQTVVEAHGLTMGYGDRTLFKNLSVSVLRGERLGILGANGAGKTTLLSILGRLIEPQRGQVQVSPKVRVAVLDQHRSGLREDDTIFESAGNGNDQVLVGEDWVHVSGFLQRFLFPKSMHQQRVSALSGGERARLLLARMMLAGANLLLLDEPTNDLDLLTLRVLEEALLSFDGAALIVTHDRAFLDRVCTGVISFEPDGTVTRYADRVQANRALQQRKQPAAPPKPATPAPVAAPSKPVEVVARKRMSYADKREFEALPERIEKLEAEHARLEALLSEPATYSDPARARRVGVELANAQATLEVAWQRWAELEALAG